ncbi:MAG TPA: pentapeptide repeat-containing protein [Herpetosiphonaceae bacterium]
MSQYLRHEAEDAARRRSADRERRTDQQDRQARANLVSADLRQANLHNANLSEANLQGATLQDAQLGDANLTHADLGGADMRDTHLGVRGIDRVDLSLARRSHGMIAALRDRLWSMVGISRRRHLRPATVPVRAEIVR